MSRSGQSKGRSKKSILAGSKVREKTEYKTAVAAMTTSQLSREKAVASMRDQIRHLENRKEDLEDKVDELEALIKDMDKAASALEKMKD